MLTIPPNLGQGGAHLAAGGAAGSPDIYEILVEHKAAIEAMGGKESVRAASTANLTATRTANTLEANSNGALSAMDGVTLVVGDRVLLKDQSTGANNGIWVVASLGGVSSKYSFTRAVDADLSAEVKPGTTVFVSEGTANGNTEWKLTTDAPITLNTTALTFTRLPNLAQLASTAAGAGASLIGIQDAAGAITATTVEGALAEHAALLGGQKVQSGTGTLVAGELAVTTGIVVTASSRVVAMHKTPAGTFPAGGFKCATRTVGAAGVGAITITALAADGTTETGATGTLDYVIIG